MATAIPNPNGFPNGYSCTITGVFSGSVSIALQQTEPSVNGIADFRGTVAYVSDTCTEWPAAVAKGSYAYSGSAMAVMESPSGFALTLATQNDPSLGVSRAVTFSGQVSGETVVGTVTLSEQQDTRVAGGTALYSKVAAFPIILR